MAVPSTEVLRFRAKATQLIDDLRDIDAILAIVEDHGANDTERQAFFEDEFGTDSNNPDLSWSDFAAGVVALRAIRTAYDTNKYDLALLLK